MHSARNRAAKEWPNDPFRKKQISMKNLLIPSMAAWLLLTGIASAGPLVDLRYGAQTNGQVTTGGGLGILQSANSDQTSSATSLNSTDATFGGTAAFFGAPSEVAQASSTHGAPGDLGGRAGQGQARLFDTLIFHIAGGGSADVTTHISGNWSVTGGGGSVTPCKWALLDLEASSLVIQHSPTRFLPAQSLSARLLRVRRAVHMRTVGSFT